MRKRTALLILILAAVALGRTRAVRTGPTDTPAAWLRHHAISLDQADAFGRLVAGSRVVALGDVTHGTHQIFATKLLFVPRLVAAGFRTIAFEGPYTEYKKLDDYVLYGTGDPAEALNIPSYWFWHTNEILDLIHWAREKNAAGLTPPIRIAAIDATRPRSTIAEVLAYLQRIDPAGASAAELAYSCLEVNYRASNACRDLIAAVRPSIESKREAYTLASSADEFEEMLHAARVVEQGERVLAEGMNVRDAPMAENVLWLADRDEKVIVIGHNEHFGRTDYRLTQPTLFRPAGAHLADALGDHYFVLGSIVLDGLFHGWDDGVIRALPLTAPSEDDFARLLDQAGWPSMIVPLRRELPSWLAGTHRMRFAGSNVLSADQATLDVTADLGRKFDAVLYVRRSTPTELF